MTETTNKRKHADTQPVHQLPKRMCLKTDERSSHHSCGGSLNTNKVTSIFENEIDKEIELKMKDLELIQERLYECHKDLNSLRKAVVSMYYDPSYKKSTKLEQHRIHPAVQRLIGKRPSNSQLSDVFELGSRTRASCVKKVDESPSQSRAKNENKKQCLNEVKNYRIKDKVPRYVPPTVPVKVESQMPRGNELKKQIRIIVGNVSKKVTDGNYDKATHKWVIYVRSSGLDDISKYVSKVRFFLHPSYKPHDVVTILKPPFSLTRRGWGEFPVRVQLHFKNSLNKPVDIIHTLQLEGLSSGPHSRSCETSTELWIHHDSTETTITESCEKLGDNWPTSKTSSPNSPSSNYDPSTPIKLEATDAPQEESIDANFSDYSEDSERLGSSSDSCLQDGVIKIAPVNVNCGKNKSCKQNIDSELCLSVKVNSVGGMPVVSSNERTDFSNSDIRPTFSNKIDLLNEKTLPFIVKSDKIDLLNEKTLPFIVKSGPDKDVLYSNDLGGVDDIDSVFISNDVLLKSEPKSPDKNADSPTSVQMSNFINGVKEHVSSQKLDNGSNSVDGHKKIENQSETKLISLDEIKIEVDEEELDLEESNDWMEQEIDTTSIENFDNQLIQNVNGNLNEIAIKSEPLSPVVDTLSSEFVDIRHNEISKFDSDVSKHRMDDFLHSNCIESYSNDKNDLAYLMQNVMNGDSSNIKQNSESVSDRFKIKLVKRPYSNVDESNLDDLVIKTEPLSSDENTNSDEILNIKHYEISTAHDSHVLIQNEENILGSNINENNSNFVFSDHSYHVKNSTKHKFSNTLYDDDILANNSSDLTKSMEEFFDSIINNCGSGNIVSKNVLLSAVKNSLSDEHSNLKCNEMSAHNSGSTKSMEDFFDSVINNSSPSNVVTKSEFLSAVKNSLNDELSNKKYNEMSANYNIDLTKSMEEFLNAVNKNNSGNIARKLESSLKDSFTDDFSNFIDLTKNMEDVLDPVENHSSMFEKSDKLISLNNLDAKLSQIANTFPKTESDTNCSIGLTENKSDDIVLELPDLEFHENELIIQSQVSVVNDISEANTKQNNNTLKNKQNSSTNLVVSNKLGSSLNIEKEIPVLIPSNAVVAVQKPRMSIAGSNSECSKSQVQLTALSEVSNKLKVPSALPVFQNSNSIHIKDSTTSKGSKSNNSNVERSIVLKNGYVIVSKSDLEKRERPLSLKPQTLTNKSINSPNTPVKLVYLPSPARNISIINEKKNTLLKPIPGVSLLKKNHLANNNTSAASNPVIDNISSKKLQEIDLTAEDSQETDSVGYEKHFLAKKISSISIKHQERKLRKERNLMLNRAASMKVFADERRQLPKKELAELIAKCNFTTTELAVRWLVRGFPLITPKAKEIEYKYVHPYCAPSLAVFESWPAAKRFASEWYRAKQICRVLEEKSKCPGPVWTTKQVLNWARHHGYTPKNTYFFPTLVLAANK